MRRLSTRVDYDPELDPTTWEGWKPCPPHLLTGWRKEVGRYRSAERSRARGAERRAEHADIIGRREEAEARLAETVRKCVTALEMGMAELKEIGEPRGKYRRSVNQLQLFNTLVHLKTKCGVAFAADTNEYLHKVSLDRKHTREGYVPLYERQKREAAAEREDTPFPEN